MWLTTPKMARVTPLTSHAHLGSGLGERKEDYRRILMFLVVLTSCAINVFGSTARHLRPLATLDLSEHIRSGQPGWTNVAFTSDATIAVSLCRKGCSLSLIQWDGEALRLSAHTTTAAGAASIYPATEGLILSTGNRTPMVWYAADLSTSRDLPSSISLVSASGKTAAETSGNGWRIYRVSGSAVELTLEGPGRLQSVSDENHVIQDGNIMEVETLDGRRLGFFSVPSERGCTTFAKIIAGDRLYLNDCKFEGIVNFDGKTLSRLTPPKGCCFGGDMWSVDGKRLLFDYKDRKVFLLRNAGEVVRMFATLGMSGEEWPNREAVRVVDTLTGKSCLDWRRSFETASDLEYGRTAAISPSGELLAIAARGKLSIYRLPPDCDDSSTILTDK